MQSDVVLQMEVLVTRMRLMLMVMMMFIGSMPAVSSCGHYLLPRHELVPEGKPDWMSEALPLQAAVISMYEMHQSHKRTALNKTMLASGVSHPFSEDLTLMATQKVRAAKAFRLSA